MKQKLNSLLNYAKKKAEFVQFNYSEGKETSFELENNSLKLADSGFSASLSVKVYIIGKQGETSGNFVSKKLVDDAVRIAKASGKKEYFYGLPGKSKYKKVDVFDKRVSSLTGSFFRDSLLDAVKQAKKDLVVSQAGISSSQSSSFVLNSEGVYGKEISTSLSFEAAYVSKSRTSYWESHSDTKFFNPLKYSKLAAEHARNFMHVKPLKQKNLPVILSPNAFSELLSASFLPNFNGKSYEKSKSAFCGKLNKKIFSSSLSLLENPFLKLGAASEAFDCEGFPTRKKYLIKSGVLSSLIYDYNTALHNSVLPTGNASPGGTDFSNLIIKFNEKTELPEKYIYVEKVLGAHTSNTITTDFSVNVDSAYLVDRKKGTKAPVKGFMIYGNMIKLLNSINYFSKKVEQHSAIYTGAVGSSSIRIT